MDAPSGRSWIGCFRFRSDKDHHDPEQEKRVLEHINRLAKSDRRDDHGERNSDQVDYVQLDRQVSAKKGKWLRFSKEHIDAMRDHGELS